MKVIEGCAGKDGFDPSDLCTMTGINRSLCVVPTIVPNIFVF